MNHHCQVVTVTRRYGSDNTSWQLQLCESGPGSIYGQSLEMEIVWTRRVVPGERHEG